MSRLGLISLLLLITLGAAAQEVSDVENAPLPGLDPSLFLVGDLSMGEDLYSEATKYYNSPVSHRRRGVDWWIARELLEWDDDGREDFSGAIKQRRLRLFGSTKGYRVGGEFRISTLTNRDWSLSADLDMRSGRDANITGLFSENFRGEFSLGRSFGDNHHLTIGLITPLRTEGLQGGASSEAITLTGDYLYNPAWGLYDGEVRNSRVRRYRVPELNLRYQLPLFGSTVGALEMSAEVGRSSLSRLGWYDGYNPTPDYYRKLPSYISNSDVRDEVEALWRNEKSDYTQIAWDNLVEINKRSVDGESHYVVEDQVQRVMRGEVAFILNTPLSDGVELNYGVRAEVDRGRYFKEMRDLLGGEQLTDIDQYIGDDSHLSNDMQNNLREPNRKVACGDRFGYDYTLATHTVGGVLAVNYSVGNFSMNLSGEFAERVIHRVGHYEKERFEGEESYGGSKSVTLPTSRAHLELLYSLGGGHRLSLSGSLLSVAPQSRELFVDAQSANRVVDNSVSQRLSSLNLGYKYSSDDFMVDVVGYFIRSRDEIGVWQGYDDLTYTYSDVVVSGIGYSSFGVEMVSRYDVSRRLRLEMSLLAGDYTYDTVPIVSLYDNSDMELYSVDEATGVVGCKVGNAPQLLSTFGVTYFADKSFILSANCSYSAGRYIAPSFMRRTERVIRGTGSPEMEREIIEQRNLGSVFDLTLGVTKTFWLAHDDRLSLSVRANNVLGERGRIDYARESNRILRSAASSSTGGYYLQPNIYYYDTPRTFYISCNYLF